MAQKHFKAESKKLLDMMIHSIYTHKEIFLRELISNASDALDKLYYKSLESGASGIKKNDFRIRIQVDKDARTLLISDNGIGMTREELDENLGTIAKSGSRQFIEKMSSADPNGPSPAPVDIIGQFGVGFYSAFMVADQVTVTSKAYGTDQAYVWSSSGAGGYSIEEGEKTSEGTDILLKIKEDTENESYTEFLEPYRLRELIVRYSDYIRYPIQMQSLKEEKAGSDEGKKAPANQEEEQTEKAQAPEWETVNSMIPIWRKQKSKVKASDYNDFYKTKFYDYEDPLRVIRTSVEGVSSFTALLFIPAHPSFDYYSKDFQKGLSLYSSGVLIMDACADLVPDYFNFVKGLVDSQDLSLNISRETLQQDRQVRSIAKNLNKKIEKELKTFLQEDREGYEKFYASFGRQLSYGLYADFGAHKDILQDLVLFPSSYQGKLSSLAEYLDRMKEDQDKIYYACGESKEKIEILPQTRAALEKGYEVLYLTEDIDEFALRMIHDYREKEFCSVQDQSAAWGQGEEEKQRAEEAAKEYKDLLDKIKEIMADKLADIKLSPQLGDAAVCLSTRGGLSLTMEKVMQQMPLSQGIKAERVLEINPDHPVFQSLIDSFRTFASDETDFRTDIRLLYNQALLISGLPLEDPVTFSKDICSLMTKDKK